MEERNQAEEMGRATDRFAEAVETFAKSVELMRATYPRPEPLPEEEADSFAHEVVHRVREELGRATEDHAPGPEEVRQWVEQREQRRENPRWRLRRRPR